VNKIDGIGEDQASAEFFALGLGEPICIAASHSRGLSRMLEELQERYGFSSEEDGAENPRPDDGRIRVGIIGRPNVGKSTLINRLTGEARVVAFDQPGTTRDTVEIPFRRGKRDYTLIDTAGVRRRGKVTDVVEKFSVIKTLKAIEESHVCVLMIDATEGVTDQDLSLTGYAMEKGRAIVVAVNKWDDLESGEREHVRAELERRTAFLSFTKTHYISALQGSGVDQLFRSIARAYDSATLNMSTPVLTRMLEHAVQVHQPPMIHGRRIRLRYAHQGGSNPPIVVIHGNQVDRIPGAYKRYLMNFFQNELGLFGTPIRINFAGKENPFEGRREKMTPLQKHKKERDEKRRGGPPKK
jgi:GTP-binding protein